MVRTEIKIAGYGGQGVITLGKLITITAVKFVDELNAAQSESYGAAARGGACWTDVVLDDENTEIDYPMTLSGNVDIAIFFTNAAVTRYLNDVKGENGIIIYDPESAETVSSKLNQIIIKIPAQKLAQDVVLNHLTANVVMFGAFCAIIKIFDKEVGLKCVKENVPKKMIADNLRAFEVGYEYALKIIQNHGRN
ncbi:MAG: 2-oxoacid:acceptor oxidoreductase family protein [Candidatus Helarchaeota archaeon]